ncbi:MAG: BON domain-containing protein [Acidobacteriota bacterium]
MKPSFAGALILLLAVMGCAGSMSTARQYDDAVLASHVREALQSDSATAPFTINVNAQQGVITLTGTVPTAALATKAGRIAETVAGVQKVENLINVGPVAGSVR